MPPLADEALRNRVELLARSPVLQRASADTLTQIASTATTAQAEGPAPLYSEGSPAVHALLLVRGAVRLDATLRGRTVPTGWYRAGEIIAEEAAYVPMYRATAVPLCPTSIVQLPAGALRAALASDAALAIAWGHLEHERLVETQLRLGALAAKTHVRLAGFLLDYARRFGSTELETTKLLLVERPTASQIAAYLGVVRQTVQKDYDKLEELGGILRVSAGLYLHPEVLERIADQEGPPSSR
ncbi:Crp/Fnr family transcriptional regulator [Sorangium sp. KYC3313]|uniref:Crp/Fnr family transcriptional regulator n=1 Tax=Sorangium sp. KYC3313 TaxID=3449740 RepID=UPI003F8A5BCC